MSNDQHPVSILGQNKVIRYNILPRSWRQDIAAKRLQMRLETYIDEVYNDLPDDTREELRTAAINYSIIMVATVGMEIDDDSQLGTDWERFIEWYCGDLKNERVAFEAYLTLPYIVQGDWIAAYRVGSSQLVKPEAKHITLLETEEREQLLDPDSPLPLPAAAD